MSDPLPSERDTLPPSPAGPGVMGPLTSAPPDPAAPTPAAAGPGYEVLAELGRGGMGVVYKARQVQAGRLVALKMILAGDHAGAADRARFRAEAQAVARLQHPHIVQVYEVGEHDGRPFFSMEFCDGGSLEKRLGGAPLPAAEAAALVETLAGAVAAAHAHRIIHRDLKPANILLAAGTPKITDFGLARKLDEAGQTVSGAIVGTPSYMAPEQAAGGKDVGPAADVYALGAILYECLTGRPPFRAATPLDTVLQVLHGEPVPPRQLTPGVSRDLETICLKCLHKQPDRRYATARELADDLARFRAGEPIRARPVGPAERIVKWVRRRPAAAALAGLSAAAVLAVLGVTLAFNVWLSRERQAALDERDEAERQRVRAEAHRREAQDNFLLARQVVDEYAKKAAEDPRLKERGVQEVRKEWLQAAEKFYRRFVEQAADEPEVRLEQARAYSRLASISAEIGTPAEAEKRYRQARRLWEQLGRDYPDRPECRVELATTIAGLGGLAKERGQNGRAEALLGEAHRMWLALAREHRDDFEHQLALAGSHNQRALFYKDVHKEQSAERELLTALAILGRLRPPAEKQGELVMVAAVARVNLGGLYQNQERYTQAEAAYDEARRLFARGSKSGKLTFEQRKILALMHVMRAFLCFKTKRAAEAGQAYHDALGVLEPLVEEQPHVQDLQNTLATTLMMMGVHYFNLRRADTAAVYYDRASVIQDRLYRNYPGVKQYRTNRLSGLSALSLLYLVTRQLAKCEAAVDKSLAAARELVEAHPDDPDMKEKLAEIHAFRRGLFANTQRPDRAAAELRSELPLREELARAEDRHGHKVKLAGCCFDLAVSWAAADPAGAKRLHDRAAGLLRGVLSRAADHAKAHELLGKVLRGRADLVEKRRPADALADRLEALGHDERLARQKPPELDRRRSLARQHRKIGELLQKQGRAALAEQAYCREVDAWAGAVWGRGKEDDPAASRDGLARALAHLASYYHHEAPALAARARPLYIRAVFYYGWLALTDKDPAGRLTNAGGEACNLAHLYNESLARPEVSLPWYALAEWLLEGALERRPGDATALRFLGNTHGGRAGALARLNRPAEALADLQRVVAYYQSLADKAGPQERLRLAEALDGLAQLHQTLNQAEEADAAWAKAVVVSERLLGNKAVGARAKEWLAWLYRQRARLCGARGKFRQGIAFLLRERRLREELHKTNPSEFRAVWLCTCLETLAGMYAANQELGKAAQAQADAVARREEHPAAFPDREALMAAYYTLAALQQANKEPAQGCRSLEKACGVWERLRGPGSILGVVKAAQAYSGLSELRLQTGDLAGCEKAGERGVALWRRVLAHDRGGDPGVPRAGVKLSLGAAACNLAHARAALKKTAAALKDYDAAAAVLGEVVAADGKNAVARRFLFNALRGRAAALSADRKLTEALADYGRAGAYADGAQKDDLRLDRAVVLGRLGRHAAALTEVAAAVRKDSGALNLYRAACVHALASAALSADAQLPPPLRDKRAEAAAKEALALLERARQGGCFDKPERVNHLKNDEDLAPLRRRRDYQAWLKTLGPKR
jgi:predicted Ser/Thr protein kinase